MYPQPSRSLALAPLLVAGCDSGPTSPVSANCDSGGIVGLGVGQTAEFQGASAQTLCVTATSGGEEFVLITTSLAESGTTRLTVENENTVSVSGPPAPSPALARSAAAAGWRGLELGFPLPDNGFHATLRELERIQLSGKVASAAREDRSFRSPARNTHPNPGDFMILNAETESACEDPKLVTGRVEAVSNLAIVVADMANPAGGFGPAGYEQFAASFDTLVAPLAEEHFGTTSDIDANGRVIILFTKEVNALDSDDDDSFTAGFFFSRHLFPKESQSPALGSCAASNEAELLYLLVPDPGGIVGEAIDLSEVHRFTKVTIVHEYQHLINASRRLFARGAPRPFEETWLNEALSHAMEELLFYRATGLSPGLDLGIDDFDESETTALNDFQRLNFFRFLEFLKNPGTNSPFDSEVEIATRGGGWNFLRYSADRRGGNDALFFRQLIDSPNTGLENLSGVLGGVSTMFDCLSDWSVGLYGDNRVPGLPMRFWDRSWNNFSLFDSSGLSPPYITTSHLAPNPVLFRELTAGGSGYFRFGIAQGQMGRISLRSGGGAPPSSLRATVLRTK